MSEYDPADAAAIYEAVLGRLVPQREPGRENCGEAFVELPAGDPSPALLERLGDRFYRLHPISDRDRVFGARPDQAPPWLDRRALAAHYFRLGPIARADGGVTVRVRVSWPTGWRESRLSLRQCSPSAYEVVEEELILQMET